MLFGRIEGLLLVLCFSYYGMGALLVLYMVKYLLLPGHEDVVGPGALRGLLETLFGPLGVQPFASQIYGLRLYDHKGVQNIRCNPIEAGKNETIKIAKSELLRRFSSRHIELVAQRHDLRLKRGS